ncbi:MAG: hypothetical protein K2J13_00275, partial [Clostridia bacterium]|nr:hypothetical protein [Clostridia bacterium]
MNIQKKKLKGYIVLSLLVILCLSFVSAMTLFTPNKNAEAYSTIPAGTISNLYDEANSAFNTDSLNKLAKAAGYDSIRGLAQSVKDNNTIIKFSDFTANTTVAFGTYWNKVANKYEDLIWIPTYVSKSDDGDPILTLWLANTESTNTKSDQEVSKFNPQYNTSLCTWENSTTYASACYYTSYLRTSTLNIGGIHYIGWGNQSWSSVTLTEAITEISTTDKTENKFVDFTTGKLAQYLVEPNLVSWQNSRSENRNDLKNTTTGYPSNWGDDKIWLPSQYEISTVWGITKVGAATPKGNSTFTWLRNATAGNHSGVDYFDSSGNYGSDISNGVANDFAVRPAIHLKLSEVGLEIPKDETVEY